MRGAGRFHRHGEPRGRAGGVLRESAPPELGHRERRRLVERARRHLDRVPDAVRVVNETRQVRGVGTGAL